LELADAAPPLPTPVTAGPVAVPVNPVMKLPSEMSPAEQQVNKAVGGLSALAGKQRKGTAVYPEEAAARQAAYEDALAALGAQPAFAHQHPENVFEGDFVTKKYTYDFNAPEKILAAAWEAPTGKVFLGGAHPYASDKAATMGADLLNLEDGFFTTHKRFLTRDQASKQFGISTAEDISKQKPRPNPEKPIRPDSLPGFVFHITGRDNLADIAAEGLKPHKPAFRGEQRAWPDGAAEARVYLGKSEKAVEPFGEPGAVTLRVRPSAGTKVRQERGTPDLFSRNAIPPEALEVRQPDGTWKPLVAREQPIALYHGSPHSFEAFDPNKRTPTGLGGQAHFFADDLSRAKSYGPNVKTTKVMKSRLLDLSSPEAAEIHKIRMNDKTRTADEIIRERGYLGWHNPDTKEYGLYEVPGTKKKRTGL